MFPWLPTLTVLRPNTSAVLRPNHAQAGFTLAPGSAVKSLKSQLSANPMSPLVGGARFELATNGLKVRCSTG